MKDSTKDWLDKAESDKGNKGIVEMDKKTIEKVNMEIKRIASLYDIEIENTIFFGSRTRSNYKRDSDVDIILVSPDFKDMNTNKRPAPFYREWKYDLLPEPEIICLSPEEYEERKQRVSNIVSEAVNEGYIVNKKH